MHFAYYVNSIQKPGIDPWILNQCMCCVLVSSIPTHAIPLTLIDDMCWFKVIAIVPYGGTMISDHGTTSKPGLSCGLQPKGSTAGARCYRGL